ncbi:MAG: hypothetical protein HC844_14180 [Tabrizicola sp.]|nr:hypothetical protein [Tabrizicola sp.]
MPDWLVPGLQILAVNGTAVDTIDDIPGLLRQSQDPGPAPGLTATLSTSADAGAAPVDHEIELPVVHTVALRSGAEFVTRWTNGAWQTEVAALPAAYVGEMRVGDIVVGHVSSDTRMDSPNAMKDVLEAEISAGATTTTLAVQQGGEMWVMAFPLPE